MNKNIFFDSSKLEQLYNEYVKIHSKFEQLIVKYLNLNFQNKTAAEYCTNGFLRRLKTLKRCIENIYNICPPKKLEKLLEDDDRLDLEINLQSFIVNIFGCLDNLAWIWVSEKKVKNRRGGSLKGSAIGLMDKKQNKEVRESFSQDFQNYLNGLTKWYDEYLKEYRHALAHRIPLYIPPICLNPEEYKQYASLEKQKLQAISENNFQLLSHLNEEQNRLGKFIPLIKHSFGENSRPVIFHAQILADWNTIVELAEKFLDEFSSINKEQQR